MTELQKEFSLYKATDIYKNLVFNKGNFNLEITTLCLDTLLNMAYNKGIDAGVNTVLSGMEEQMNGQAILDRAESEKI